MCVCVCVCVRACVRACVCVWRVHNIQGLKQFQHLPLTAIVSGSSSSVLLRRTAVRRPWLERIRDRRQSIDRESWLWQLELRVTLYSGATCMARLSYLASWGSGMRCAIAAHSYRLGVVDERDFPSPGFIERTRDNSRVSDPTRSAQAVQCR